MVLIDNKMFKVKNHLPACVRYYPKNLRAWYSLWSQFFSHSRKLWSAEKQTFVFRILILLFIFSGSPYFKSMFNSGMLETTSKTLELPDIQKATFKAFRTYIYTGQEDINSENVVELLRAAAIFQVVQQFSKGMWHCGVPVYCFPLFIQPFIHSVIFYLEYFKLCILYISMSCR